MNAKPLDVIDANFRKGLADGVTLHEFGDGLYPECACDLLNRLNHRAIGVLHEHLPDERPVNFQIIDGKVFQIAEGGHAGTEIVECEMESLLSQAAD